MFTRTHRTRLLAAATLTAAVLTLTACNSGEGVNDEGASAGSAATPTASASATPSTGASEGTTGSGKGDQTGANSGGTTGGSGSSGSTGSQDSGSTKISACTPGTTRTTATEVSRPLNHMLLTVTNTGSKTCTLVDYPAVKFTDAQSVPPVFEDSIPQSVVTLAPGESGYASVLLSAADGSGGDGYTAKSLEVYFNIKATTAAKPSLPKKGVYIDSSIQVSYWQSTMADALAW